MNPRLLAMLMQGQGQDPNQDPGSDEDYLTQLLASGGLDGMGAGGMGGRDQYAMSDPGVAPPDADPDMEQIGPGGSQSPYAINADPGADPGQGADPAMAELFRSLTARQPKPTTKQRFLGALPSMLRGALAGGATPNVAGGGATDMFRAAMSGMGQADAQNDRDLALQDRDMGRKLQLFRLGEAMQNHQANQQRLGMESQARQGFLQAQADSHKARAAQILDNMKRGIIVVDRKGALKLNPQTGQYEPMDFTEQAMIKEIAGYTKALRQQGWSDEEVKDAIKRKYTDFKEPKPVVESPAEIKLKEQKRLAAISGKYLRMANGNAAAAIQMAQADQADPEFAEYGGLSDQDFAMIEVDLRKRVPRAVPPPKPNTGMIRLNTDQQADARANQFLRDSGGDAKKATLAAMQAGDTESAKRLKPLAPTNEKKNVFAGAAAAGGGTPAPAKKPMTPEERRKKYGY